jgi:HK97 family phage portal protein
VKLFGLDITRTKTAVTPTQLPTDTYADSWNFDSVRPGWFPMLREGFMGAWQRGMSTSSVPDVLRHSTAWSCITLIANDISKMAMQLVEENEHGICEETTSPAFSPVLRRPNRYQNRIQFIKAWIISKLTRGNTYVLKERDRRGIVTALYILDPTRVQVAVGPDGSIWYQLSADNLAGLEQGVTVPASEIIHDIYVAPYHPLVGVSPIYAAGMAAMQGLKILQRSEEFFDHGAQPSGVLVAPAAITQATMDRLEKHWQEQFAGPNNVGKIAALGDGLKFEQMSMTAVDAQLIDQLKWGDERVCSAYHTPAYMVGVGTMPAYNNIESLNQQYFSQCLQELIESIELCLEEGLGAADAGYEIEFDLESLLRMDSVALMKAVTDGVKGTVLTPNEGRKKLGRAGWRGLDPIAGGDTVYMQQQNYSLAALAARDLAKPAPDSMNTPAAPGPAAPDLADGEAKALLRKAVWERLTNAA